MGRLLFSWTTKADRVSSFCEFTQQSCSTMRDLACNLATDEFSKGSYQQSYAS